MIALLMAVAIGGWALEPPKMQCLKLMNNNQRMKMAWSNSEDCASFKTFYFYINNILCDSLSCSQGFNFCNYGSKDINNIPRYERIALELASRIANGEYERNGDAD